ncbi:hypothetical protein PG993_014851 [Apiospora rasikravindrae]|uniref:C2H2-type domain-containing protein n=1 Tax=Apiospora rasikravindrae TaxID=990691 RepID=A0ABR1RP87_9PEZI
MDGYTWEAPPLPLLEMTSRGRLRFACVKQAEEAAEARDHVACPLCCIVHSPLRCLDKSNASEFPCAKLLLPGDDDADCEIDLADDQSLPRGLLGLPPRDWHPLIIYAFGLWSKRGRDTAPLRNAAGLDYVEEDLDDEWMVRDEWKLNWVPEHGLFAYWRHSQLVSSVCDDGRVPVRDCCACGDSFAYDPESLNHGLFEGNAAILRHKWRGDDGAQRRSNTQLLSGPPRELVVSQIHGCRRCGRDYQLAWQACETEQHGACHWLHFTTWFYLGKYIDVRDYYDEAMGHQADPSQTEMGRWPLSLRSRPVNSSPLDIGEVAGLSGFPGNY